MVNARLSHVRWLGGGTGAGKSTLAAALARRFGVEVYDGDLGERDHLARCTPFHQPRLLALAAMTPAERWLERRPTEIFAEMPALRGETFGFVLDDLRGRDSAQTVVVDDFRTLPMQVAEFLEWPGQAVFLLPTPEFRRTALSRRYADPDRARANWGDLDPAVVLEARLARDVLWDAEVARQAEETGLPVLRVDGGRTVEDLAGELAERFRLDSGR